MAIRVHIATTEGAVVVERITREIAARSAVCLGRTTRVLPVSDDYDAFVRPPSGVIEREFGPFLGGAFRLDVSGEFGGGQSIPMATDSVDDDQGQTDTLSLLIDRTKRSSYLFFSVYSTEYDYCENQPMKREHTKMLGIAGKFHTLEEGGCPTSERVTG